MYPRLAEVHIYQESVPTLFDFSLNAQSKCDGRLDGITPLIGIKFLSAAIMPDAAAITAVAKALKKFSLFSLQLSV